MLQSSGAALHTDKATDLGEDAEDAALDTRDDAGNQATPKMHPHDYGQAHAAKSAVVTGEPQEALVDGEGQLEQSQP